MVKQNKQHNRKIPQGDSPFRSTTPAHLIPRCEKYLPIATILDPVLANFYLMPKEQETDLEREEK